MKAAILIAVLVNILHFCDGHNMKFRSVIQMWDFFVYFGEV